ncbi:MAG: F0F1 ATP synthase subunit delta [Dermatophilaceae bacterium]
MQGASRAAAAAGQQGLDAALSAGADGAALSDELFAVARMIDGNASLRRAVTDPTREATAKGELVERLLRGKVGDGTLQIARDLAGQRWSSDRDLADTLEDFAVQALVGTEAGQARADQVEDELFRFERIVAANPALRDALTDRRADPGARLGVVTSLLGGKAQPETVTLAGRAVATPRGRRFDRVVEAYLRIIARRREQLSATVTCAIDLDVTQRDRLAAALRRIYGQPVHLNVVVDPRIVGGIRVQVGDEVVDGTILRRLDEARRHIGA